MSDDGTRARHASPVLSAGRLALAVFGANMSGGTNLTRADGPPVVTWDESVRIARLAERAGFDALVPVARWRSPGEQTDRRAHRSFEPFAWAAGIAAVTEHIGIFATVHVPTMHPLRAAKEIATVDHISGGRFGLNLVAGWNQPEFEMFGHALADHDTRYDIAAEWIEYVERAWGEAQPFDVSGPHYSGRAIVSEPHPVQAPRPVVMSAGFSPAGRAFAAAHADVNVVITPDRVQARATIAQVKQQAKEQHGRQLKVFGAAHVLCRDDDGAAAAEYRRVVHELGDWAGAESALQALMGGSQSAAFSAEMRESAIFGFFANPVVGSADHVVEQLAGMADDGLDGVLISWVDYEEGLEQFAEVIMPRLVEAGLRSAPAPDS